jgi:hypothetical protein
MRASTHFMGRPTRSFAFGAAQRGEPVGEDAGTRGRGAARPGKRLALVVQSTIRPWPWAYEAATARAARPWAPIFS